MALLTGTQLATALDLTYAADPFDQVAAAAVAVVTSVPMRPTLVPAETVAATQRPVESVVSLTPAVESTSPARHLALPPTWIGPSRPSRMADRATPKRLSR